jgi:HipA-like protein
MKSEQSVFFETQKVGGLFEDTDGKIAFRYEPRWLANGFEISHSMLLGEKIYHIEANSFFSTSKDQASDIRFSLAERFGLTSKVVDI